MSKVNCDYEKCIWNKLNQCTVGSLDIRNGKCDLYPGQKPSDDAIKIVVKAMTHITQKVIKNKYITDLEVLEYAKALISKLNIPEPKQFNEAEIREILYDFHSTGSTVTPEDFDKAVFQLSTLTPKAQGEVEKGKPSICDEIETEVNKDE